MICRKCGKEIKEGAQFCTFCGSNVVQNEKIAISEFPKNAKNPDSRSTAKSSTRNKWVVGISAVVVLALTVTMLTACGQNSSVITEQEQNEEKSIPTQKENNNEAVSYVSWMYEPETKELVINGSGAMPEMQDIEGNRPWEQYADEIETVIINDGITRISDGAFCGLSNLRNIELPKTIAEIGYCAFIDTPFFESLVPDNTGRILFDDCLLGFSYDCGGVAVIPKEVRVIADGIFSESISTIESESKKYIAKDGVLYNTDETVLIAFPSNKQCTTYDIPDDVKRIGRCAFMNNETLIGIDLPNSLEIIDDASFSYCTGLSSVSLPDGVKKIGRDAFYGSGITSITVPNSVSELGESAFAFCDHLSSVLLPDTITKIPYGFFWGCYELHQIQLPNSVIIIEENAFSSWVDLQIQLSDNIKYIEFNALPENAQINVLDDDGARILDNHILIGCDAGTTVHPVENTYTQTGKIRVPSYVDCVADGIYFINAFESNSPDFAVIDYCLYSGDGKTLVRFPDMNDTCSGDIPNGITSIRPYAFFGCSKINRITLPNTLEIIGKYALAFDCREFRFGTESTLSEVVIPKSVKRIELGAFMGLEALNDVYYDGTENEWNKIWIDSYNEPLLSATLHFSDGSIRNVEFEPINITPAPAS